MATTSYARTLVLEIVSCPNCGVEYGVPDHLYNQALKDKAKHSLYCPNGHPWYFTGKSDDELRREAEAALVSARDQLRASLAETAAKNRELRTLKRRAAAGVCPCCHRSFVQLNRHMSSKHPNYGDKR